MSRPGIPGLQVGEDVRKNLATSQPASCQEVIERMVQEAEVRGGDAVLAFRFDAPKMGGNWIEICAYRTA